MPRHLTTVLIVLVCALLQACGTAPSLMARPAQVGDTPVYVIASGVAGAIPVARNASVVHNQLKAFETTWRGQAKQLRFEISMADNLQFASLVWSTYKVATGHLHDAKWGAAVAGGVGLFESKYQLEVQASDYSGGAAAMLCLQSKVDNVSDVAWIKGYDQNTGAPAITSIGAFAQQFGVNQDDAKTILDCNTYRLIWNRVNDRLNQVDSRLSDQLDHIRIGIPSSDELSAAFSGASKTSVGGGSPAVGALAFDVSETAAITSAMMADLTDLPKQMDTCIAAMGK